MNLHNGLYLFRKIFLQNGICLGLMYFCRLLCTRIFNVLVFGRWDIRIAPMGARILGCRYMKIGESFFAGRGLWLQVVVDYSSKVRNSVPNLIIGDRVSVGEYVHIGCNHRVVIGNDVLMGSKIYITDHNHGIYRGDNQDSPQVPPADRKLTAGESVEIGERCWIGEFVTILPGVTIGKGCIIGSHSTVTHDIPANSIAVGSPARVVKQWNEKEKKWLRI